MRHYQLLILLLLVLSGAMPTLAQDTDYTGTIDDTTPTHTFTVTLVAGDSVLMTALALSGNLDITLELRDPSGELVAYNDNISPSNTDSQLYYVATTSGDYTVIVGRYEFTPTSGDFGLTIEIGADEPAAPTPLPQSEDRYLLSSTPLTYDTTHFRIHYTLEGFDATTDHFAEMVGQAFEQAYETEIEVLGWPAPPADFGRGGDDRYDVYLGDLQSEGDYGPLGYAVPEQSVGDNPLTSIIETNAAPSYIVLENDFSETDERSLSMVFTVIAHEFHHAIQFGYDRHDSHGWYYEASAVYVQTRVNALHQDARTFSEYNMANQDICFGTESQDPRHGSLQYGDWLFMQAMVDEYGEDFVFQLWSNIATGEGFGALATTLDKYDDTVPSAVARYRIQNLVLDYQVPGVFASTVPLQGVISRIGRWTTTGSGVQELGASYLELDLSPDSYRIFLTNDGGGLELWAVAIRGTDAEAYRLGREGVINTDGYDYVYLMVFNPSYDDNPDSCQHTTFALDIQSTTETVTPVDRMWNAALFQPPPRDG